MTNCDSIQRPVPFYKVPTAKYHHKMASSSKLHQKVCKIRFLSLPVDQQLVHPLHQIVIRWLATRHHLVHLTFGALTKHRLDRRHQNRRRSHGRHRVHRRGRARRTRPRVSTQRQRRRLQRRSGMSGSSALRQKRGARVHRQSVVDIHKRDRANRPHRAAFIIRNDT